MKVLIGGAKSKLFHLKEFGETLTKFNIDYKLVEDVKIYTKFPSRKISDWFQTKRKFNSLISEFKPDIVFIDRPSHFGLAVVDSKIPLYIHLRGDYWSEMKWAKDTLYKLPHERFSLWCKIKIAQKCFNSANTFLPICNYLNKITKTRFPNKRVETLYQGIDPARWYSVDPMNLKHPCVGLLQDANIWGKVKEMTTLTKVIEEMPNVTFYWVGDGPYTETVLSWFKKYDNFKWLGRLDYPDKVREYLMGIDVYALISGIDMSPLTLQEAQLMKKPVVATKVGGIPELMESKKTGFLVEKEDHKTLSEKLSLLISDNKLSSQMGAAGREFIKENFSWDIIAKRFLSIVNKS